MDVYEIEKMEILSLPQEKERTQPQQACVHDPQVWGYEHYGKVCKDSNLICDVWLASQLIIPVYKLQSSQQNQPQQCRKEEGGNKWIYSSVS